MTFAHALKCRECGREYPLNPIFSCEFCFGPLEVAYDYDGIRSAMTRDSIERGPTSLWRYAELLPCALSSCLHLSSSSRDLENHLATVHAAADSGSSSPDALFHAQIGRAHV